MNVYEMEGFLRGKCMPRDILVNESTAEYLVRKLNESTSVKDERDALAVENAELIDGLRCIYTTALIAQDSGPETLYSWDFANQPAEEIEMWISDAKETDAALAAIRTNYMAEGAEIVASKAQVIYQERHKSGDFESAGKYLTTIKFANNISSDIREAK